jgi:hypothetical protein
LIQAHIKFNRTFLIHRLIVNRYGATQIVKKYKGKPEVVISDLQKKYSGLHHFPARVLLADVQRIAQAHTLPACLLELLPPLHSRSLPPYDATLDIRSAQFDAVAALRPDRFGLLLPCAPLPGAPPVPTLDNLSQVPRMLLPGSAVDTSTHRSTERHHSDKSRKEKEGSKEKDKERELAVRALDRIALASSKHKVIGATQAGAGGGSGGQRFTLEDNPLALLFKAMQERRRVRVVIRRVNR